MLSFPALHETLQVRLPAYAWRLLFSAPSAPDSKRCANLCEMLAQTGHNLPIRMSANKHAATTAVITLRCRVTVSNRFEWNYGKISNKKILDTAVIKSRNIELVVQKMNWQDVRFGVSGCIELHSRMLRLLSVIFLLHWQILSYWLSTV